MMVATLGVNPVMKEGVKRKGPGKQKKISRAHRPGKET